jgi:hypothetical protein
MVFGYLEASFARANRSALEEANAKNRTRISVDGQIFVIKDEYRDKFAQALNNTNYQSVKCRLENHAGATFLVVIIQTKIGGKWIRFPIYK